jgi:hypothetical protein
MKPVLEQIGAPLPRKTSTRKRVQKSDGQLDASTGKSSSDDSARVPAEPEPGTMKKKTTTKKSPVTKMEDDKP